MLGNLFKEKNKTPKLEMNEEKAEEIADNIHDIVKKFVRHPDAALVKVDRGDQAYLLTVCVAEEDRGQVIGKKGAMSEALRVIARAQSVKLGVRVVLTIEGNGRDQ